MGPLVQTKVFCCYNYSESPKQQNLYYQEKAFTGRSVSTPVLHISRATSAMGCDLSTSLAGIILPAELALSLPFPLLSDYPKARKNATLIDLETGCNIPNATALLPWSGKLKIGETKANKEKRKQWGVSLLHIHLLQC